MNEPFFLFGRKVRKESMTSLCPELKQGRRNDRPKVSVIVVTYNHQDYLKEALDSILEQDCSFGYEVIVADDCSTDETLQVAQEYRNRNPNRIRILESAENNGPFRNGRRAFPLARGAYIALLDGDDFWLDSRKLEKQSSYLDRNPQCVMTYASIQASMNGKIDFDYIGGFRRDLTSDELILTAPLNTSTVMFRKVFSTLPNLGSGFTPDLLLWSLLGRYGSGHYHEDILPTHYRIHDRGYHGSRSLSNRIAMRLQTFVYLVNFYSTAGNGELTKAFIGKVVLDMVQLRKLLETESEEAVFETIKAAAKSVFAPSDDFIDLLQLIWKQTRISSSLVGVEAESRLTELETLAAARN
jgi:hypothetical protein